MPDKTTSHGNQEADRSSDSPDQPADPVEETAAEDLPGDAGEGALDATADSETPDLEQQLRDCSDQLLRAQAELDNQRKRLRRDLDQQRRYAGLPLVQDLLPVLDNLQLAIDAAEQNAGAAGLLEGVKMVSAQLTAVAKWTAS